jgi:predicted PurR-regulated permease PerM
MTPLIVNEVEQAINDVPAMLNSIKDFAAHFGITIDPQSNGSSAQSALTSLRSHLPDVADGALSVTSAIIGGFFEFLVILLFTFFLLANQDRFRRFLLSFMKPGTQTVFAQAWDLAVYKTGGYLYSRILTSVLAGTVVGVALALLDCPYALALAIWYGIVSQFLPMIGTYVAAALPLVILLTRDPLHALIFLLVLAVWIPFQDYVISPKVSARTMELSPATALIALLAGGALFGALGAFLALPAAAVIQSVLTAFFPRHEVVASAATRS